MLRVWGSLNQIILILCKIKKKFIKLKLIKPSSEVCFSLFLEQHYTMYFFCLDLHAMITIQNLSKHCAIYLGNSWLQVQNFCGKCVGGVCTRKDRPPPPPPLFLSPYLCLLMLSCIPEIFHCTPH